MSELVEQVRRTTAGPFGVLSEHGYWLCGVDGGQPVWSATKASATSYATPVHALRDVARFEADIWRVGAPLVKWLDPADGFPAVLEVCDSCRGVGRVADVLNWARGERWCLACGGHGERAVWSLSTVQVHWGNLVDLRPVEHRLVHLVRKVVGGGCPGRLLCGMDFRRPGGPGYSVGGGVQNSTIELKSCHGCVGGARKCFADLPVCGLVGGRVIAADLGVRYVDPSLPHPAAEDDVLAAKRGVVRERIGGS